MFAVAIPANALGLPSGVLVAALVLATLVYVYSAIRRISVEGVTWDSDTMEIRNAWRTYSVPWSDVGRIDMEKPWWLRLDEGKSDLYVPVVKTTSGQQIPISAMYCDSSDPDDPTTEKGLTLWVDKSEIRALLAEADTHLT